MEEAQLNQIKDFLEEEYKDDLLERGRKGKKRFYIDYNKLVKYEPGLAELLLDEPAEFIDNAEAIVKQMDECNMKVRILNSPESCKIQIREIRSKHLNKFVVVEGILKIKSDVRPKVTTARFECPSCSQIITVLQQDNEFTEPKLCSCGRKGTLKMLTKELIDAYGIVIEELPENTQQDSKLKRLNIFARGDLADTNIEGLLYQGLKIEVSGILKEAWITTRKGKKIDMDIYLDVNYIDIKDATFFNVEVSKEDIVKIKAFSKKEVLKLMVEKLFLGVYGYDKVKEAMILSAFGGNTAMTVPITRGQIHILLVGDPGAGKTSLLKICQNFLPKSKFLVGGKTTTGVGLIGAVIRDELLGGWSFEAGAIPLCHQGTVLLDELDKLPPEEREALHESLEILTVTIAKANINQSLQAHTTLIAGANPIHGRWDEYEDNIYKQINLSPTLVNRFDLIFVFKAQTDKEKDRQITMTQLRRQKDKGVKEEDIVFLRKYIAYAKTIKPVLSEELIKYITDKYIDIKYKFVGNSNSIPITSRQVDALRRLTEAYARSRLSTKPTKNDADMASEMIHYYLSEIATDKETGRIDIDKIEIGMSHSRRTKIDFILKTLRELTEKLGGIVPIVDLQKGVEEKIPIEEFDEIIENLNRKGEIFFPTPGMVKLL